MAKTSPGKRDVDSYTIKGTNKVVRAGDYVLMRPSDTGKPTYVARVEKIEADSRNNVHVPSAHTIEGKCIVHSFKNYTKLENVGAEDYYCRFEYKAAGCEKPYNPVDVMVQCETCKDWYPSCVDMTIGQAKKLEHFICSECTTSEAQNGFHEAPADEIQVETKRRERWVHSGEGRMKASSAL